MAYSRGNTVSSTQAADVYAVIATKFTEEGWIKQGADIVGTTFTWRIWRAPQANTLLPHNFHIAIGHANTGTGALLFRVFRDLVSGTRIRRPIPNAAFVLGSSPDAYGDKLHDNTGTLYPVPWTTGTGVFAVPPAANPDYTVALWNINGDYLSITPAEQALLDNAPPQMDFRSVYVREYSVACDDSTAVEYIVHVTPKRLVLGTKLIFNNTQHRAYVGNCEPLALYDTMSLVMGDPISSGTCFYMHDWRYVDLPPTMAANIASVGVWNSASYTGSGTENFGRVSGVIRQNPTESSADNDWNWRGPLGARRAFRNSELLPIALTLDMPSMPNVTTGGNPQIDFGDEVLINNLPHTLLWPGTSTFSLWVPQS